MILSIDIGGTAVKMGLVDETGVIHARHEASVCFDNYETPILTTVIREAKVLLEREGVKIEGIGVSATGQVDDRIGAVVGTNGKIPHYEGAQIKKDMEAEFAALAKQYELEIEKIKEMVPAAEITASLTTRKAVKLIVDSAVAVAPKAE